jgi:hypothetical protein
MQMIRINLFNDLISSTTSEAYPGYAFVLVPSHAAVIRMLVERYHQCFNSSRERPPWPASCWSVCAVHLCQATRTSWDRLLGTIPSDPANRHRLLSANLDASYLSAPPRLTLAVGPLGQPLMPVVLLWAQRRRGWLPLSSDKTSRRTREDCQHGARGRRPTRLPLSATSAPSHVLAICTYPPTEVSL